MGPELGDGSAGALFQDLAIRRLGWSGFPSKESTPGFVGRITFPTCHWIEGSWFIAVWVFP